MKADPFPIYTVFCSWTSFYFQSMEPIDVHFARTLRALRKARGLTQESLAQRAGIDYKYLQKLESSKPSSPTLATLDKLAAGLQISLVELIRSISEDEM